MLGTLLNMLIVIIILLGAALILAHKLGFKPAVAWKKMTRGASLRGTTTFFKNNWKTVGKVLVGLLTVGLAIWLVVFIKDSLEEREMQEMRRAIAKQEAHKAFCASNPYDEKCFPQTKEIAGIATETGPVVIVIPPNYRSELWGDTTKMRTELRKTGKFLYRYVWAKSEADTVHVTAIVSRRQ